ncbi:MAG: cyclic pyranopterin monophosphate synthase MoaC [Ancrocorticia sp.]
MSEKMTFTHLNGSGEAYMVDVTAKQPTVREATAISTVYSSTRGDRCAAGRDGSQGRRRRRGAYCGIAAAKGAWALLPLTHTIGVHGAAVDIHLEKDHVAITATVRTADRTGVEMEALTAVTVAALAVVDMVKGVDRSAAITDCKIIHKAGGRSGDWHRPGYEG